MLKPLSITDCQPFSAEPEAWARDEWMRRLIAHRARVAERAEAFVDRRSRGLKHPVHDFLFTYYSFSPAKLMRWVPPMGVVLEGVAETDLDDFDWRDRREVVYAEGRLHTVESMPPGAVKLAGWVAELCDRIASRPVRARCYGLHEWAMVLDQKVEEVRHQGYELRMSPEDLAVFVRSQAVCCTHYDAFRFFTPVARPLNAFAPTLETRLDMEQAGCLHANMDLYKWSYKLWPWVGSDLVGQCFELAVGARELDMRASPYELRHLGYDPIRIETPEGREVYEQAQRDLSARTAPLRMALRDACNRLLAMKVVYDGAGSC
ncbi:MAG: hypothetical protein KDK97_02965 [Verrucomicrobiales bacterium]|nr:hypothetical protein [Verrucomicrobiales bacterium]MCP5556920.1 hypothetical protein [Verrucomicrobiaceae bacterium]